MLKVPFETLPFGQVANDLCEANESSFLLAYGRSHDFRPVSRPFLADPPAFNSRASLSCSLFQLLPGLAQLDVSLFIEPRELLPQNLFGAVTLDALRPLIPSNHAPFRVEHEDGIVLHAFHEQTKSLFTPSQRFSCPLPFDSLGYGVRYRGEVVEKGRVERRPG